MKRLLAYLFIVLGLGLVLNISVKANPWLVIEGANLGVQLLKKGAEKISEITKNKKKKK